MKVNSCFTIGILGFLASMTGCGSLTKSVSLSKVTLTDPNQGVAYSESWMGVSQCSKMLETLEPNQRQGEKGRTITWSVCGARVSVECKGKISDQSQDRSQKKSPPKNCTLNLSGEMQSSELSFSPMSFSLAKEYSVSSETQTFQIPFAGTNKYVSGMLTTPMSWGTSPGIAISLRMEGQSSANAMMSVSLTKSN